MKSRKSYCTTPGVGVGGGVDVGGSVSKMLKFFMWWARHCQASYPVPVTGLVNICFKQGFRLWCTRIIPGGILLIVHNFLWSGSLMAVYKFVLLHGSESENLLWVSTICPGASLQIFSIVTICWVFLSWIFAYRFYPAIRQGFCPSKMTSITKSVLWNYSIIPI